MAPTYVVDEAATLANELLARVFALERRVVPRIPVRFGSSLLAFAGR